MPLNFSPWGPVPDSPDLQKRLKSACDAKLTPVELDREAKTAVFSGDHGVYETRLNFCNCTYYGMQQRKGKNIPCKHILRLAMELGLIEGNFKTDPSKVKSPPHDLGVDPLFAAVNTLESMPETLHIMSEVFRSHANGKTLPCYDLRSPAVAFLLDNELLLVASDGGLDVGENVRGCHNALRTYIDYRLYHKSGYIYTDPDGQLKEADKQLSDIRYKGVSELLKQHDPFYRDQIGDPNQAIHAEAVFRYEI